MSNTEITCNKYTNSWQIRGLVMVDKYKIKSKLGSSGIWTRDLSHPKRESYP